MRVILLFVLVFFSGRLAAGPMMVSAGEEKRQSHLQDWVFEVATAYQDKIVSPNAEFPYRILSGMTTVRTPAFLQHEMLGGTLGLRHAATLLTEAFYRGPETHYFGLAIRPSIEWWPSSEKYFFFFSPGGGAGALDSRGISGGQGQDFTLNILVDLGAGIFINQNTALKLGLQYHHFSNGGQTEENPGLNVLGPEIGLSIFF